MNVESSSTHGYWHTEIVYGVRNIEKYAMDMHRLCVK